MKIEITKTTTTTTTTEKEIELPYYCTDNICYFYKVFSKEKCIAVYLGSCEVSINIESPSLAFSLDRTPTQCTKEVFQKMYDKALSKINKALEL